MPVQDALTFLHAARRDETLGREIDDLEEASLDSLVEIGERAGLSFTPEELQRAHALDWRMRWARYASSE